MQQHSKTQFGHIISSKRYSKILIPISKNYLQRHIRRTVNQFLNVQLKIFEWCVTLQKDQIFGKLFYEYNLLKQSILQTANSRSDKIPPWITALELNITRIGYLRNKGCYFIL